MPGFESMHEGNAAGPMKGSNDGPGIARMAVGGQAPRHMRALGGLDPGTLVCASTVLIHASMHVAICVALKLRALGSCTEWLRGEGKNAQHLMRAPWHGPITVFLAQVGYFSC